MVHSCDVCFQCQHRSYNKDMAAVDKKTAQKVALDIESLRKDIGAVEKKTAGGKDLEALRKVGPGGCCSPRNRVLFNSRDEGSKCV
jgi:hypothetical protein